MIENWESLDELLAATWIGKDNFLKVLKKHPEYYTELLDTSLGDQYPQSWRAAWLIGHTMKKNDNRVRPYISRLIQSIPTKEQGHQRQILIILLKMDLDEDEEGILLDECLKIWESIAKISSTRITAFKFFLKMVNKYPELKSEIGVLTEKHYTETLTPGMQRMLNKLIARF